ncbi:MAG TPA: autotransporter assembly complex family protein [Gallionella sp.]|nr:autotransporter assembly complex family protein [Gallionella sp.]
MTILVLPCLRLVSINHVKLLLVVMLCSFLTPELALGKGSSIPAVNLTAPETVRAILAKYFIIPDTVLKNENERAIFMRRAQREIPELLATEGYFSSKVLLRSVTPAGVLELEVIPGQRTVVTEVKIEFRGDLSLSQNDARMKQLRAEWLLQPGMPFRSTDWDEAKANLLAQVASRDYAAARLVDSSAQVDPAKAGASLHVVVDSGPRFLFGDLQITGLERYEKSLVSRRVGFSPGQPYDRKRLLAFQNQLQNMPQFSSVTVSFDTNIAGNNAGPLTVPVKVHIVEAQSRKLSLGIGYSTNNGVRNQVNYQSYNFLNQAWTLNGAWVFEQNSQTLTALVDTQPNPLGYHLTWNASGEKTQIQGLDTRTYKIGATRSRTLFDIETGIGLNGQREQQIPLGGISESVQALVLDWHWNRRAVDNPLFPMSGSLTQLLVGGASKSALSDQDFVRSYFRQQVWLPLGERDVVTLRVEGGYTAATSRVGIPQDYLFRVGGTQTVRGFAYQSLGVIEGNAVVGGRVMATGSAEYTHWFGKFGAALFMDVGGAADVLSQLRMSQGYGIGARWRSPVGPLALDFARGKGQPGIRIHFSVAVAF